MKELLSRFHMNGSILKFRRKDLTWMEKYAGNTRLPSFSIRIYDLLWQFHNLRAKEASRAFAKTLIKNCLFLAQGITLIFVCFSGAMCYNNFVPRRVCRGS